MEYNKEDWIYFIDNNLANDLKTEWIAAHFNISRTHFKRLFFREFNITVSDYVRKRRLSVIAELIRTGKNYQRAAARYGYRSQAGIYRAFVKEYLVTPAEYKNGEFFDIALENNVACCSKIQAGVCRILGFKMEAVPAFCLEEQQDEKRVSAFWRQEGFPLKPSVRLECNRQIWEDKTAFRYQDEHSGDTFYMIGDVVKYFREEEDRDCLKIEIPAGRYAIFQTDNISDENHFIEVREIIQMVQEQWIRENEERIDGSRISFERFVNRKMYLFVPVKE